MRDGSQSEHNEFRQLRNDLIEFLVMLEKNREKYYEQTMEQLKAELKEFISISERKRIRYLSQTFDLLHVEIKKAAGQVNLPGNYSTNRKLKISEKLRTRLNDWLNKN